MTDREWTAERLERLGEYWTARIVMEAAAFDLFERIAGRGRVEAAALAADLGTDPHATVLWLDALAAIGLLRKQDGGYENAEPARRFLVPGSDDYVGHTLIAAAEGWTLWGRLRDALRTGRAQRDDRIFTDRPEAARHLLLAIHRRARPHVRAMLDSGMIDPERYSRMLDVGGGAGTYAVGYCRANPALRATLVDLAPAIGVAREVVAAAGLESQIRLLELDFEREPVPGTYDLVWVSNVVHGRGPDANRTLFERLAGNLDPGGELIVHDVIMTPDRTAPARGAVFSLHMLLNNGVGRCYTYAEVAEWLTSAGLVSIDRVRNDDDHELVVGRRP